MPRTTGPTRARAASRVERHAELARSDVVTVDRALDEVHRRRADECRDEEVSRVLVEPLGRVHLQDPPASSTATRWPSVIASTWSCVT